MGCGVQEGQQVRRERLIERQGTARPGFEEGLRGGACGGPRAGAGCIYFGGGVGG